MNTENRPAIMSPSGQTSREGEVPDADFDGGMNIAGSCSSGIGININQGAVVGTPEQFTLLDQNGDARLPQRGSHIGNTAFVDRDTEDWPSSGGSDGNPNVGFRTWSMPDYDDAQTEGPTPVSNSYLETLAGGWTETAP